MENEANMLIKRICELCGKEFLGKPKNGKIGMVNIKRF